MLERIVKGGYVTLIDECDQALFCQFSWSIRLSGNRKKPYVVTSSFPQVGLHRLILDAPIDKEVDHINGNSLDNRRKNLRTATGAQNAQNSSGWGKKLALHSPEHPVYKGVWPVRRCNGRNGGRTWEAKLCYDRKQRYIGSYHTAEEAAHAYDDWARTFHGRFARLNFPQLGEIGVHDFQGGKP